MNTQQQQQLQQWVETIANWQTLTDAQVAAAYAPGFVPVPYTTFQPAVMQLACWGMVRAAAANLAAYPAALQPVILTAVDLFTTYKAPNVDLSLPAFQQALTALTQPVTVNGVSITLVSQSDAAAILALGQVWPVQEVTSIAAADVTAARAAIAQQATGMALVQNINAGQGAALSQVNQAINSGSALPAPQQVITAYVAAAYPGYTVAVTAPQGG